MPGEGRSGESSRELEYSCLFVSEVDKKSAFPPTRIRKPHPHPQTVTATRKLHPQTAPAPANGHLPPAPMCPSTHEPPQTSKPPNPKPQRLSIRNISNSQYLPNGLDCGTMIRTESILDLATVASGQSHADALQGSIDLAQTAEKAGYQRIWYAEHHNMNSIASSSPAVLIAAVAAKTESITLGSGGVMLPNHAPLTVAEQFGTLANLYPDRIELGLGRAPGTDQATMRALRRDPRSSDSFPQDVQELRGYLSDESLIKGINAIPGRGTHVPLYILGSSLFGAQLAAALGLPYAFASHFAPDALRDAIAVYREQFQPSEQLDKPYAFAAMNVIASESEEDAQQQYFATRRNMVRRFLSRGGHHLTDDEAEILMDTPQGRQVQNMFRHTAVGTVAQVREQIAQFGEYSTADELIVAHQSLKVPDRLRSVELTAEATGLTA